MKRWLIRIVVIVALVEVGYLAIVNTVLNLPATQTLLNQLQPERFVVHWDFAWSWFPLVLRVRGLSVNGQSWSQQFDISAPSVSASLAIGPLFSKTIHVTEIETGDISIRLRPRVRADHDDTALRQFYPTIEGRDPNAPAEPMPVEKPGWKTVFDVDHIGGRNDIWLAAIRMTLAGEVSTTVTIQNPHGLLAISGGKAEVSVEIVHLRRPESLARRLDQKQVQLRAFSATAKSRTEDPRFRITGYRYRPAGREPRLPRSPPFLCQRNDARRTWGVEGPCRL